MSKYIKVDREKLLKALKDIRYEVENGDIWKGIMILDILIEKLEKVMFNG